MNKFKVGDRVKRVNRSGVLKVGEVYTVEYATNAGSLRVQGYEAYFDMDCFELASDNEAVRKDITDAVETLATYNVWRSFYGSIGGKDLCSYPINVFLDKHYPIKTPQQLEIESIRKEQEKLVARLKELEK